jgi:hypothetical protein
MLRAVEAMRHAVDDNPLQLEVQHAAAARDLLLDARAQCTRTGTLRSDALCSASVGAAAAFPRDGLCRAPHHSLQRLQRSTHAVNHRRSIGEVLLLRAVLRQLTRGGVGRRRRLPRSQQQRAGARKRVSDAHARFAERMTQLDTVRAASSLRNEQAGFGQHLDRTSSSGLVHFVMYCGIDAREGGRHSRRQHRQEGLRHAEDLSRARQRLYHGAALINAARHAQRARCSGRGFSSPQKRQQGARRTRHGGRRGVRRHACERPGWRAAFSGCSCGCGCGNVGSGKRERRKRRQRAWRQPLRQPHRRHVSARQHSQRRRRHRRARRHRRSAQPRIRRLKPYSAWRQRVRGWPARERLRSLCCAPAAAGRRRCALVRGGAGVRKCRRATLGAWRAGHVSSSMPWQAAYGDDKRCLPRGARRQKRTRPAEEELLALTALATRVVCQDTRTEHQVSTTLPGGILLP